MSCATPGHRDGESGHLCRVTAARLPQAVARAGAHLLRLESLQLGCCCHLLCWERAFSLPPPLVDLLSPGLGWRVGSPSASSAECLPRRRRSQQTRRQTEGLFPSGPLERSLQQGLGAGRLSTACPSSRRTSSRLLLPLWSCRQSLPHGDEQANPCPAAGCQSCSHPLETCCPGCPDREGRCCSQRCQSLPVPYLGWLWVLPCRPGFPRRPFCLGLLSPLLPVGLHLLPLCRQLPDLLEGTEMQQQAGLVSAPGGASFGSDPRCCPLPQPLGRQRFAPNGSGAVESCQAPQLPANAAE